MKDMILNLKFIATSDLPTKWGTFQLHGFEEEASKKEHVVLSYGDWKGDEPVLARVHSECLTGDALFSLRCDCGFQLETALEKITEHGSGVLMYLRQEGRGIGLMNKIRAYNLQDQGADTVQANEALGFEADLREYSVCKTMLEHLNISAVKLMTNNPRKVKALESYGIKVSERLPLHVGENRHNEHYLSTKHHKLGHLK